MLPNQAAIRCLAVVVVFGRDKILIRVRYHQRAKRATCFPSLLVWGSPSALIADVDAIGLGYQPVSTTSDVLPTSVDLKPVLPPSRVDMCQSRATFGSLFFTTQLTISKRHFLVSAYYRWNLVRRMLQRRLAQRDRLRPRVGRRSFSQAKEAFN